MKIPWHIWFLFGLAAFCYLMALLTAIWGPIATWW